MPNGDLLLVVGRNSFVTSRDIPVQPGATLQLEVQQIEPKLILKLVDPRTSNQSSGSGSVTFSGELLKGGRPLSTGFAQLISGLEAWQSSSAYAEETKRSLLENTLKISNLNATSLRAAFLLSGVFTEALWRMNQPELAAKSMKSVLLVLKERITGALQSAGLSSAERNSLARLLGNVDNLIGSVTKNQISSLPNDGGLPKWVTTLPFQWGSEIIEIDVELNHRRRSMKSAAAEWQFCLSLELEALGKIRIVIGISNLCVDVDFSVEPHASRTIENSMPLLKSQLVMSGFEVNRLVTEALVETPVNESAEAAKKVDISI